MSGNKPEQEPSIEEILASIRQIISDDDDTRQGGEIEIQAEEKFDIPVHQPDPVKEEKPRESFADILELTNEVGGEEKVFDMSEEKFNIPLSKPTIE